MESTKRQSAQGNASTTALLRSFADRIVRLKEEIKELQSDIKDIKEEAHGQGFDKRALMVVVSRMMEDEAAKAKRIAVETYADVYLATLGMLDGTPLGDAARRHIANPPADIDEDPIDEDSGGAPGIADAAEDEAPTHPPAGAMSQEMIDDAREQGRKAAAAGAKIFANPYVAGDPRRAGWDEGWCQETGSDGMEIPKAWRRAETKKADKGSSATDGGEA